MIQADTCYKAHDAELLAIVKIFKTWKHYLEGYKHEVLIFTDHSNLQLFMDTKNVSSRPVQWAQEQSKYYFQMSYCQEKVNKAADALS